jgi:putative alpha-1,2-mannosidase
MVGDHAAITIIDAYRKGLRGFDISAAYSLMRKNAILVPTLTEAADGKGRRGLSSYLKYGYIPLEDHITEAFHKDEQVSRTLEYAYDDAIIGELAAALGKKEGAALFRRRGQNWRKVIDPQSGFARGRYKDGTWITPFDPGSKTILDHRGATVAIHLLCATGYIWPHRPQGWFQSLLRKAR